MYLWGWGPDADPDFILSVFTTGQILSWSDCFYSNPEYDALYDKQHVAVNFEDRRSTIIEMQKLLYNEAPYVVLDYALSVRAVRTDRFTGWVDPVQNPGWDVYWWKFPGQLEPIRATPTPLAGLGTETYIAVLVVAILAVVGAVFVLRRRRAKEAE
jgi:ABC-type oligopeptide transport system substrate-binding subunit